MWSFRTSGALWAHAGFLRLWAAQTVSSFGARIAREGFAMSAILSIHARPAQLGVLAALTLAPGVVVGLTAGGFVDRSRRRRVMIGADLFRTAVLLTIPVAAWTHLFTIEQLFVAAALVGAAGAMFGIADHAYLPSLIAREHLIEGNTKLGITESVAEIGGPALAGTLFQLFTPPVALLGTALTYLVSAAFLLTIRANEVPPERPKVRPRWHRDLREGLDAILGNALVRPLLWMAVFAPLFGSFFGALYMIYGIRVLGFSPALMGIVIAMGGIGALAGASLSSWLAKRIGVGPTIIACAFGSAVLAFLIPVANGPMWLRVAVMMLTQLGGDAVGMAGLIVAMSLRQSVLPRDKLGRTAAIFRAAGGVVAVFGAVAGGLLGEAIGIRPTLFLAAAFFFVTPLFGLFSPLRHLRDIP